MINYLFLFLATNPLNPIKATATPPKTPLATCKPVVGFLLLVGFSDVVGLEVVSSISFLSVLWSSDGFSLSTVGGVLGFSTLLFSIAFVKIVLISSDDPYTVPSL